jgi:hypothetical protein
MCACVTARLRSCRGHGWSILGAGGVTLLDIFPPGSAANATIWVTEAAGHIILGLVLTVLAGAVIWLAGVLGWRPFGLPSVAAAQIAVVGYGLGWEVAYQRLGAGLGDALVDTAFVAGGAVIAWASYERKWSVVLGVILAMGAGMVRGVRRRG